MEAYFRIATVGDLAGLNHEQKVLIPADEDSRSRLGRRSADEVLRCFFKLERNYQFLKKAHALIKFAFDCQEVYSDINEFREAVTIEAGFFTWKKMLGGEEIKVAKSWAFDAMTEAEFGDLYNAMIAAMLRHSATVFNGVDAYVFERQLSNFSGENW